jgi:hypothetical protein
MAWGKRREGAVRAGRAALQSSPAVAGRRNARALPLSLLVAAGGCAMQIADIPMKTLASLFALTLLTISALADDGPIRHVVHFKFKSSATPEQIQKITQEFAALKTRIPVVESLEWGKNVSPEGLSKGFDYCWIVTFKSAKDRDTYLVHPAHEAFKALLKPVLDDVLVVDFVPEK